jgi:hypothetical protein
MADTRIIKLKNGKPAVRGICPKCGGSVFKIGLSQPYAGGVADGGLDP